jgi:hypothetical protein
MIAALICVISVTAFMQFFISYCRSALATSRKVSLSEHVQEITGIASGNVAAADFPRLLQLVRLCPERADDQTEIRAVGTYYSLLAAIGRSTRALMPKLAEWTEQERRSCSYFAAVALDRRITYTRGLYTEQVAERL